MAITGRDSPKSHSAIEFAVHVVEKIARLATFAGAVQLKLVGKDPETEYTLKASSLPQVNATLPLQGVWQRESARTVPTVVPQKQYLPYFRAAKLLLATPQAVMHFSGVKETLS